MDVAHPPAECPIPLQEALTSYCFNALDSKERQKVGLHLLECDSCWREVQRLEACVRVLRHDPQLKPLSIDAETVAVLGMSARLDQPLGGHSGFATFTASVYGLLHGASVWTELSYSYNRFAILTWVLSLVACASVATSIVIALHIDARQALKQRTNGLAWSAGVMFAGLGILTSVQWWLLPHTPTVQATFETRSAAGGFLKNELLYFVPLLLFLLPTFHAIVRLQGELRAGRIRPTRDLLTGSPESLAPRGVWFVPLWLLVAVLLLAVVIGDRGVNNLLDHLTRGPYSDLFTAALYVRVFLWYLLAVGAMLWYQRALSELKRETLIATRLFQGHPARTPP